MADKKLNEVTKVTDMAYVPVIMSDGSIGQIAKADLASVVAGRIGSYKTNTVANGERFVTYVAPQFMLAITGSSSGSALYLGNINFLSQIVNTLYNVSVTINAGNLSIQNDSGGDVRYSILLPS